ncbi:MAG: MmcQ/YjbR family DNA-binding protein [Bacteroidota bacterium]
MNIEEVREYCTSKKGCEETFPFDEETLVFKVMGKMFALMPLEKNSTINLKCDPDRSIELREKYDSITPGYHMSKKHWNTINYSDNFPRKLLTELIDHSYELVVSSLTKKLKEELKSI